MDFNIKYTLVVVLLSISIHAIGQMAYLPIPIASPSVTTVYTTWDSTKKGSSTSVSSNALTATNSTATNNCIISTVSHATGAGKYYCEIYETFTGVLWSIGLMNSGSSSSDWNTALYLAANGWTLSSYSTGAFYHAGTIINSPVTGGTGATSGLVICMAFDAAAGNLYMGFISGGVNNWFDGTGSTTTFASATPVNGATPLSGTFFIAAGYQNNVYTINAGQSPYAGVKPAGYVNW